MTEKADEFVRKSKLKINEQKGLLTLQTQQLAVQTIFNSPILEVCAYQEQLAKYHYRAALSRINLRVEDFDYYYSELRQRADQLYHSLLLRSLYIFQDLLISAKYAKIQLWQQHTGIANGLRTNLYGSSNDPYNFRPSQFDDHHREVIETMRLPISKSEESRMLISDYLQRMKKVEAEKMEMMFVGKVEEPYIARNKNGLELNPSTLYNSFQSQLRLKLERSYESMLKKYFNIHDEVLRFGQGIFQHNLKLQRQAAQMIKKYSDSYCHLSGYITPPLQLEGRRQHLDADHLSLGKQVRSQARSALANRNFHVEFKQYNRILNVQSNQEELVQWMQNEQKTNFSHQSIGDQFSRHSNYETISERKKLIYKDYCQQRELEKRFRDDSRFGHKQLRDRQKEKLIVRRVYRANPTSVPWGELSEFSSPFLYFMRSRAQKQISIWQLKNKYTEEHLPNYRLQQQKSNKEHNKAIAEELLQNEKAFQKKRRNEEEARLNNLKSLLKVRTYQKFLAISKIETGPNKISNKDQFERYGIVLRVPLWKSNWKEADKFFYYYFKQRFYRQHQQIKENADNPIIYLDSTKISMSSSLKVVSQLVGSVVKRVDSLPFFLIWSEDIIGFRVHTSEGKRIGRFQCYNLARDNNCKKLIYQIRRRVSLQITQQIYEGDEKTNEIQKVMRKVETTHRLIYNRHCPIYEAQDSVKKGIEIAEEIFKAIMGQNS